VSAGSPGCTDCDDGVDNDQDSRTDYNTTPALSDPGCLGPTDASEQCVPGLSCAMCDDSIDNDNDGRVDFSVFGADPGCSGPADNDEHGSGVCDDGLDNDSDGLATSSYPEATRVHDPGRHR